MIKLVPEEAWRSYFQEIGSREVVADMERKESNVSQVNAKIISYLLSFFKANADLTTYPAAFTAFRALEVSLKHISYRFVRHNNHLTC